MKFADCSRGRVEIAAAEARVTETSKLCKKLNANEKFVLLWKLWQNLSILEDFRDPQGK